MDCVTPQTHVVPQTGQVFVTVFSANPKPGSAFRFKATRIDGRRSPKVILCNDAQVQVGAACRVRVVSVKKPGAKERGHIEVSYVGPAGLVLDAGYYADPVLLLKLQAMLECGMNVLLDGPQGSGKTVMSRLVAEALGMEYVFFNCAALYEPTDILATLQIGTSDTGQIQTVWVPNDIYRALIAANENPHRRFLCFLDEFNRCRETARNGVMTGLDSTRRLHNPMTNAMLTIPDNVQWIAAINNGPQFTGTTTVDPAQLDRFAPLKIGYPPADAEKKLLAEQYPRVGAAAIERVVDAANAVRQDADLRVDLSVRATKQVCELLGHANFTGFDGDAVVELIRTIFCGRFPGQWDDPTSDAGMVWQVIVRRLEL